MTDATDVTDERQCDDMDEQKPQPPLTKPKYREHVLSKDCWCKPSVVSYR